MNLAKEELRLNHPVEFMRFSLFFHGDLATQTNRDNCVPNKQVLRRAFHSQLAELWETHPVLLHPEPFPPYAKRPPLPSPIEQWREWSRQYPQGEIYNPATSPIEAWDHNQFRFVPLVTRKLGLSCELDIVFLRNEPPGYIFDERTGDVDGRLKVLFDALRMPDSRKHELPATDQPQDGEYPFFCLLEDDKLITRVSVETERLLEKDLKRTEVELLIRVTLKTIRLNQLNMGVGE